MLAGVRVLDMGSFITAPLAATLLAEMGADVIKVERPDLGDPFRRFERRSAVAGPEELYAPQFRSHNRHKRSVVVDYTTAAGLEIIEQLVAGSDVVLINSRPGVPERYKIGYEDFRKINESLIYCDITGFGRDGPYADRPAFDSVGQALSGWGSRFRRDSDPRVVGPCIADPVTSYYAALGVLGALVERSRSGQGHRVEVNLLEPLIAFGMEPIMHYLATGIKDVYYRGGMSQAYSVTCRDGKRIALHPGALDKFWDELAAAIDRRDLVERYPTRALRIENYATLANELNDAFAKRDRADWLRELERAEFPYAPELEVDEVDQDAHVRHLGTFYEMEHPSYGTVRGPHRPILVDGSRDIDFRPAPALGEHTTEILSELGVDQDRLEALEAAGVIQTWDWRPEG